MIDSGRIQEFIWELAQYKEESVFNPWSQTDSEMDIVPDAWINRQMNLHDHLKCDAEYILVGEAPGYQGCRYTGVPFTSERLLLEGSIPRLEYNRGIRITTRNLPWSEPSATIVWNTLKRLQIETTTVLWNAFPFHPFKQCSELTNRTPTNEEIHEGRIYMKHIRSLFPISKIICVGNTAESLLGFGGFNFTKVRHPANGGATLFRQQMEKLL